MITEGFIDGDLVERFLDLSQGQMEDLCKGLKVVRVRIINIIMLLLYLWEKEALQKASTLKGGHLITWSPCMSYPKGSERVHAI